MDFQVFLFFALLILGFILLVKGADWLVTGATSLAKKLDISELAIGLTIVAFGTSAPEMVVNVFAGISKHDEVVFGNVFGSNVMNTLLILGISGLIYPITVQGRTAWREIPFSLLAALLIFFFINDQLIYGSESNILSHWEGIVGFLLFCGFLYYVANNLREETISEVESIKVFKLPKTILLLILGTAGLVVGGRLTVNYAVDIAYYFNLSEKLIGLTIIAIGTSLPELATCVIASLKSRSDIAVGNIVGSNIFNLVLVLPVSAIVSELNYNEILNLDLGIFMLGTILLFVFTFTNRIRKINRWEAATFLLMFIAYFTYLWIRR